MAKYHINPETGNPGVCRAKKTCPFGDLQEDHYPDQDTARTAYEVKSAALLADLEEKKLASELEKQSLDTVTDKLKTLRLSLREELVTLDKLYELEELEQKQRELTNSFRDSVYGVRISRRAARAAGLFREADAEREALRLAAEQEALANPKKPRAPRKALKTSFDKPHEKNDLVAATELAAWCSNLTVAEALNEIKSYSPSSGLTRDQYVVSLFQKHAANPRPIAFLDLETSGFTPSTGEIIEIGVVVVDKDGNVVKEVDERFDFEDSEVRRTLGTGNVEVHGIEPEDLEGKRCFTDPMVQKELGEVLNDPEVVICAHNAPFESRWLNHYLTGFQDVHDEESAYTLRTGEPAIPVQDTQNISKMLMHSTSNDKLESFAEANGVPYVDSHSAFPDAQMTQRAYSAFRKSLVESPVGQRPLLTTAGG